MHLMTLIQMGDRCGSAIAGRNQQRRNSGCRQKAKATAAPNGIIKDQAKKSSTILHRRGVFLLDPSFNG
ncbi:MAG: hypothetical protein GY699_18935 [Desulfobacteraceae bacterium]|nr:hypothetical protein [Desulfobacteraceae bacterium]